MLSNQLRALIIIIIIIMSLMFMIHYVTYGQILRQGALLKL